MLRYYKDSIFLRVLIVPSGIETNIWSVFRDVRTQVLIVPSGIETMFINGKGDWGIYVLIVPSGIETHLEVAGVNEPLLY